MYNTRHTHQQHQRGTPLGEQPPRGRMTRVPTEEELRRHQREQQVHPSQANGQATIVQLVGEVQQGQRNAPVQQNQQQQPQPHMQQAPIIQSLDIKQPPQMANHHVQQQQQQVPQQAQPPPPNRPPDNWAPVSVANHNQPQPTQNHNQAHPMNMITDDIRFTIIEQIAMKPGIWDCLREKTSGQSRRDLFVDVTNTVNQQHNIMPPLSSDEVEKQWKNLKDTYLKTKKKLTFDESGCMIPPKWKFFSSLGFLDHLHNHDRHTPTRTAIKRMTPHDEHSISSSQMQDDSPHSSHQYGCSSKRIWRNDDNGSIDEDEQMNFCRYLYHPLREIAHKDQSRALRLQKAIIDMVHEVRMEVTALNHNSNHNML